MISNPMELLLQVAGQQDYAKSPSQIYVFNILMITKVVLLSRGDFVVYLFITEYV